MADVSQEPKEVKVRKDHRCHGCRKEIKKGGKAIYSKYVNADGFYSFYECHECYNHVKEWCFECRDYDYCIADSYTYGLIKECKEQHFGVTKEK